MSLVFVFLFSCGGGNLKKPNSPLDEHPTYHTNPTVYPVSGIWDVYTVVNGRPDPSNVIFVPSHPPDNYQSFDQATSFCAPQVSAIARLLYSYHPERSWQQVRDHMINTRRNSTARGQIAGIVDFKRALSEWAN